MTTARADRKAQQYYLANPDVPIPDHVDMSIEFQECHCSLVRRCDMCREGDDRRAQLQVDPVVEGGPAVPAAWSADNDVNPACGCHLRSKCMQCSGCTGCDGCYCGEE